MTPLDEPPKVSIFSRVLAWVFVFCGVLGIAGWIIQIYDEGWPWDWGATLLATLGLLLIFPLFFFVALKGRPPRWFNFIENQYNQQIVAYGNGVPTKRAARRAVLVAASVTFGLLQIYFGKRLGLFADENRWFAISIFVLVWLSAVVCMSRYFRK